MFSLDIAGIAISAFFILFIFSKRKGKNADWVLLLSNLNIIGLLVADAMFQRQLTPSVLFLLNILPLYLLPLFLIFALETLQEKIHHRGRWILLFLPALISSAYIGSDLFILHNYNQSQVEQLYNSPTLGYQFLCKGFPIVFMGAYIWLIKRLKRYAVNIKDSYSFIDPIELNWLTNSTWIYLFITLLSVLGFIIFEFRILPITSHLVCTFIGILLFLAIFYINFHGIHQYTITEYYGANTVSLDQVDKSESTVIIPDTKVPVKYKASSLSSSEQEIIFEKVIKLFEEKKLYQEPKLQLSDVSNALSVSPHSLSQTINATTGKPFYDFVNSYRVRHLQKLLEEPSQQKFTILAMGFESGFNSKASLNRVFRQETGLSPSEYLERYQLKQVSVS